MLAIFEPAAELFSKEPTLVGLKFRKRITKQRLSSSLPYPILFRRHAHCLLERAAEILRILVAEAVGYLADALAGLREQLLGHIHRPLLDVFLRRAAGLLLYQVAEVVGREMHLVGTPCHGGRAEALGIVRHEIAVEQRLEACEDVLVRPLARDELAVAVVEEQLDGRDDDGVAVAVGAVPYLVVNLAKAVDDGLALLKRQVEGPRSRRTRRTCNP